MVGCLSRTVNYLSNYQYLDLRNADRQAKSDIEKLPHGSCGEILKKSFKVISSDMKTLGKDFFEVGLYLCVLSPLRTCGVFCPPEPTPPVFPSPHDDGEFVQYSIERGLWRWDEEKGKQMKEDISTLSGSVMPVIAQWTFAYSYDNLEKRKDYIKPSFLTMSASLEGGESYASVGKAFSQLKPVEKKAILEALYRQEDLKLGCFSSHNVRKVYNDIRGLAYKLTQGNKNFTSALQEYIERLEESEPVASSASTAAPVSTAPSCTQPRTQTITPARVSPSAPAQAPNLINVEREMTRDVAFLRTSLMESIEPLSLPVKNKLIDAIKSDRSEVPYLPRNQVVNAIPNPSLKFLLARLSLVQFFKNTFWESHSKDTPRFYCMNNLMLGESGKTVRDVGQDFSTLQSRDIKALQQAIIHPSVFDKLKDPLKRILLEINEFAAAVCKKPEFLTTYNALRTDLAIP